MRRLLCAAVCAMATTVLAAEDTKLGAGVTMKEATPIQSLLDTPADFVGKSVRVDGIATAVCEEMGCWLQVAADDSKGAKTLRLKVEDGVIVFPMSAKGKHVSAEGVFEEVNAKAEHGANHATGAAHGAHAAASQDTHAAQHGGQSAKTYQIKATGAVVKD